MNFRTRYDMVSCVQTLQPSGSHVHMIDVHKQQTTQTGKNLRPTKKTVIFRRVCFPLSLSLSDAPTPEAVPTRHGSRSSSTYTDICRLHDIVAVGECVGEFCSMLISHLLLWPRGGRSAGSDRLLSTHEARGGDDERLCRRTERSGSGDSSGDLHD